MGTLEEALLNLQQAPFPEFPEDDDLADWLAELAEIDGHVAGLARGALSGARVSPGDITEQLESLAERLALAAPSFGPEVLLAKQYQQYLHLIRRVAECLRDP